MHQPQDTSLGFLGQDPPAWASREQYSYPAHTHAFVIELMRKFQLCWRIGEEAISSPNSSQFPEPEFNFSSTSALGFVLHYPKLSAAFGHAPLFGQAA